MHMMELTDQMGRKVAFPISPQRVVSLCPSPTETIFALGAGSRLVGRTDYCCHPADQVGRITSVGGTKSVDLAQLDRVEPDLIISVKEENLQDQMEAAAAKYPVLILDPVSFETALEGISLLGRALDAAEAADRMVNQIASRWQRLSLWPEQKVLYLIWRKPWMAVGRGTYIDAVLQQLGLRNVVSHLGTRYPEVDEQLIRKHSPDLILASSEPFPFSEKHLAEIQRLAPDSMVQLVDGELFSWHGARMLPAADYFDRLCARF